MKPIKFPEANAVLRPPYGRPDIKNLVVLKADGQALSCWKMSPWERIKALIFGKVWLSVLGDHHPPVWLICDKDAFEKRTRK
jgi:hypothetical protein